MPKNMILFVCTGNICRSPMAEYLLRNEMEPDSKWDVRSAGVIASYGIPASPSAVKAVGDMGIDMTPHRSQPVSRELISRAALIVVMTADHGEQLRRNYPDAQRKVFLMKSFGQSGGSSDVDDPMGSTLEVYIKVRNEIGEALPDLISFLRSLQIQEDSQ